jgi:hypothetical protein
MSEFRAYLQLGFYHITDLKGYDHILFIMALCAVYQLREWKNILILITAFTIGHSITLALATFKILVISSDFVEFLIPVTILLTAFGNLLFLPKNTSTEQIESTSRYIRYLFAVFFGLIHGLGFSNFLRVMLMKTQSIFMPLLAFNIGLELGQILIVLAFLLISTVLIWILLRKITFTDWKNFISGSVAGIAFMLLVQNEWLLSWWK